MSAIKEFIADICWKKYKGMTNEEIAESFKVPGLITEQYIGQILDEWYDIVCGEKEL